MVDCKIVPPQGNHWENFLPLPSCHLYGNAAVFGSAQCVVSPKLIVYDYCPTAPTVIQVWGQLRAMEAHAMQWAMALQETAGLMQLHSPFLKVVFWVTKERTPLFRVSSKDCVGWGHKILLELFSLHPAACVHKAGRNLCPTLPSAVNTGQQDPKLAGTDSPVAWICFLRKPI